MAVTAYAAARMQEALAAPGPESVRLTIAAPGAGEAVGWYAAAPVLLVGGQFTAALDRLGALRTAPGDAARRRVWAQSNALRKTVVPPLTGPG